MPGIKRLTESDMPIRLALSLHAPENDLRSQIMPVNERYDLQEVLAACEAFYERKRRMVFIEYVMLAGVNDSYAHAVKLAQILDPKIYKLNLIPYNPTDSIYDGSSRNAIETFRAALEEHGLSATVRLTRGRDIDAACGQLGCGEVCPASPASTSPGPCRPRRRRAGPRGPARSWRSPRSRSRRRRRWPSGASALGFGAAEQLPAGDLGRAVPAHAGRDLAAVGGRDDLRRPATGSPTHG